MNEGWIVSEVPDKIRFISKKGWKSVFLIEFKSNNALFDCYVLDIGKRNKFQVLSVNQPVLWPHCCLFCFFPLTAYKRLEMKYLKHSDVVVL